MSFRLDDVVPWGRSFEEYLAMFALTPADLSARILGCGDGPAAFNAGMTRRGLAAMSLDPLYRFTAEQIRARIAETRGKVVEQLRQNADAFRWNRFQSPEDVGRVRMAAMEDFLADYPVGLREGRYRDAELPFLPFPDGAFRLGLCSHLLFLYADHLDQQFHLASLREMVRVCAEVRVFPLLALDARRSTYVEPLIAALRDDGFDARTESVPYEFQKCGNEMLRITRLG